MKFVLLKPKTKKGKSRVRTTGEQFTVIGIRDSVLFSGERGPWLLCRPVFGNVQEADLKSRWVNLKNDPDFDVEVFDEN